MKDRRSSALAPKVAPGGHAKVSSWKLQTALFALVVVSALTALSIGPVHLSLRDVVGALLASVTHGNVDPTVRTIIVQIRLPRIVLELLVGGSLAAAGLAYQALLRNDLAEPYTTGVSAGASVGAGLVIVLGASQLFGGFCLPLAAFVGGCGVLLLVYGASRRGGRVDVRSMLLIGVVASAFLWALHMLLLRLAGKNTDYILGWLMGSLANAQWRDCAMLAIFAGAGVAALATQASAMNLFAVGEISAQQLGLDTERFKRKIIIAAPLLAAATVAVAGIVAFVGLVVPHIARRLARTPDHRRVLPIAILCGALMLVWSDTIARVALGGDRLPVGVITAFWGGPFFWQLLRKSRAF